MTVAAASTRQRVNSHGRIESAAPALAEPDPAAACAAVGFTVEPLPHGMAELRDPHGTPCGRFSNSNLAPRTLSILAFLLR